jgi:hypothetical protein
MDKCQNCGEAVEATDGVIDLNNIGLCEACAELKELCRVLDDDERQNGDFDFDYSMNG